MIEDTHYANIKNTDIQKARSGRMKYDFSSPLIKAEGKSASRAARLFYKELVLRGLNEKEPLSPNASVEFLISDDERLETSDCYSLEQNGTSLKISAKTVRGLIFGYSLFLRKCECKDGKITLIKNISGLYSPDKKIRGHQIGYRTCPNTYDAWSYKQYFRYYLDMAAFGCNTCEHIPYESTHSDRNALMKYDEEDFLVIASRMADAIDMDVSIWHPNCGGETENEAFERRKKLYSRVPRIDAVFPPGGDPGSLPADEFIKRSDRVGKMLKELHPKAQMWPSAQAPHIYENWGEDFLCELEKSHGGIDGVIMGPNHAFPMHELRKRLPARFPLRFYPDITHCVRCEYPVHFLEDDWHFSFASAFSRESVCPRPTEFALLHRLFSPYTVGSVSYSEGVHDDLNKMLWSALEFDKDSNIREIILDYARFFMYGADPERLCDAIFALEKNWDCDPLLSPCAENTYNAFCALKNDYPNLNKNWRFLLLYFRACCDEYVYKKRRFETKLLNEAYDELSFMNIKRAKEILNTPPESFVTSLRSEISSLGKTLFEYIGIQLDVEHYLTNSWERGATLDTVDNPVTDRLWLSGRISYCEALPENERSAFIKRLLSRNKTDADEVYFSVALHELKSLGVRQSGEFYMNFQGDNPNVNNGSIPMSMLKVYDHYSFSARFGGFLEGKDYILKINYKSKKADCVKHHKITANGTVIYDGVRFGGSPDALFDRELSAPGFETAKYILPSDVFKNGTLELKIEEPLVGFELCELWITKKEKDDSFTV